MTPHRIYVAGGSSERLAVRGWIERLTATGLYEVTHDWTRSAGYDRPRSERDDDESATSDSQGVIRANVVWFLVPDDLSEGLHYEAGLARGLGKTTVASGRSIGRSVFHARWPWRFETHEEAYDWLVRGCPTHAEATYYRAVAP